jgi:hypothetical protein
LWTFGSHGCLKLVAAFTSLAALMLFFEMGCIISVPVGPLMFRFLARDV